MPTRRTRSTRRAATRRPSTRRAATSRRTPSRKAARQWTREEISFMRKYYKRYETAWIARQLGRTVYSVRYKAVDLSIKKASPSVWRGNKGSKNAFRKPASRKAAAKRSTARRSTARRSYRASSARRSKARRR